MLTCGAWLIFSVSHGAGPAPAPAAAPAPAPPSGRPSGRSPRGPDGSSRPPPGPYSRRSLGGRCSSAGSKGGLLFGEPAARRGVRGGGGGGKRETERRGQRGAETTSHGPARGVPPGPEPPSVRRLRRPRGYFYAATRSSGARPLRLLQTLPKNSRFSFFWGGGGILDARDPCGTGTASGHPPAAPQPRSPRLPPGSGRPARRGAHLARRRRGALAGRPPRASWALRPTAAPCRGCGGPGCCRCSRRRAA